MSTLKSILHHWDSSSSSYDTLHPQTESGAITDWHESVIGSLASEVLPTVVSELTTDSVLGKLYSGDFPEAFIQARRLHCPLLLPHPTQRLFRLCAPGTTLTTPPVRLSFLLPKSSRAQRPTSALTPRQRWSQLAGLPLACRQWGNLDFASGVFYADTSYPITFSTSVYAVLTTDVTGNVYVQQTAASILWGKNDRLDALHLLTSSGAIGVIAWLAVGR